MTKDIQTDDLQGAVTAVLSLYEHPKSKPLTLPSIERLTHYRYGSDPAGIRAAVRSLVAEGRLHKAKGSKYDDGSLVSMWIYYWPVGLVLAEPYPGSHGGGAITTRTGPRCPCPECGRSEATQEHIRRCAERPGGASC